MTRPAPAFTWDEARHALAGLPGGRGVNIAYEAVDRHAAGARAGRGAALRARRRHSHSLTYRRAVRTDQSLRQRAARPGHRARRARLLAHRAHPRAVRRGARHPQERQRLLPAVLGLRPRTRAPAAAPRLRPGAGHHPGALPQEDRAASASRCRSSSTCSWSTPTATRNPARWTCGAHARGAAPTREIAADRSPRTWRCCTSPAAPRARPRVPSTCTTPSSRTTRPARSPSTCTRRTSTGARPTPAGSPAPPTA